MKRVILAAVACLVALGFIVHTLAAATRHSNLHPPTAGYEVVAYSGGVEVGRWTAYARPNVVNGSVGFYDIAGTYIRTTADVVCKSMARPERAERSDP